MLNARAHHHARSKSSIRAHPGQKLSLIKAFLESAMPQHHVTISCCCECCESLSKGEVPRASLVRTDSGPDFVFRDQDGGCSLPELTLLEALLIAPIRSHQTIVVAVGNRTKGGHQVISFGPKHHCQQGHSYSKYNPALEATSGLFPLDLSLLPELFLVVFCGWKKDRDEVLRQIRQTKAFSVRGKVCLAWIRWYLEVSNISNSFV
jgi:hypothetical protein